MRRWILTAAILLPVAAYAGTITRPTKGCGGSGSFVDNCLVIASDLNGDIDPVYTVINGNLEDINIKAAADIALTKLGDTSTNAAAHDADTTPGSYASRTLPTTLTGEIQQLRYKVGQSAGLQACARINGTGTQDVGWVELPATGENLVTNSSFAVDSDGDGIPEGWAAVGGGSSTVTAASTAEGFGYVMTVAGLNNTGVAYTFDKLRASTRYAVYVRAALTAGAGDITTTGADAASEWRDLDINLSGASFADYCGVIATDTTPTNVAVQILGDAGAVTAAVREVSLFELGAVRRPRKVMNAVATDLDTTHTFTAGAGDTATDASLTVNIPDINYYAKVTIDGYCYQVTTGAGGLLFKLQEDGVAIGSIAMGNAAGGSNTAETPVPVSITRASISPTTGNHTYRAVGSASTRDWTCEEISLVVERIAIQ
jgi:hypothetical protein